MATAYRKEQIKMRHVRLRKKVAGTTERPRLAVHFSGKNIYAQIIDDSIGQTIASVNTTEAGLKSQTPRANSATAATVGKLVAERARAKNVTVLLENTGNDVILIVEDDGVGFLVRDESESRKSGRNLGLKGMRERAILMGGMLEIESSPGRGTTIYVRVPHEPEQTEL